MGPPLRALVSVSDKTGLVPFVSRLVEHGYEIVSSGGTRAALSEAGVSSVAVEAVTGFPEIFKGRVKTLHPLVHGGILGRPQDGEEMIQHGIEPFAMVVVNLYPFEERLGTNHSSTQEMVELIDIGGPAMVRAAAKNHDHVTVVVDPEDYDEVAEAAAGPVPPALRVRLAAKAFARTAQYDASIATWMAGRLDDFDATRVMPLALTKALALRYGENHHQEAAFYHEPSGVLGTEPSISTARQLGGKELSYNNVLDADTALELVKEFSGPAVAIIKHATPSGAAQADDLVTAWRHAFATDTYSPFGGVVACNRVVEGALAEELAEVFLELIIAPGFDDSARERLGKKKNLRLLEVEGLQPPSAPRTGRMMRSVVGGVLVQDRDTRPVEPASWKVVTTVAPTEDQIAALAFAARVVKHVRSNAVVFAHGTRTVGIGGGQTARVDAVYIATKKGGQNIQGSVLASDAFFPFRDTIDAAAAHGVAAIVQPGGSIRDEEVIQAANEHGIAMVFSGHRSFRH